MRFLRSIPSSLAMLSVLALPQAVLAQDSERQSVLEGTVSFVLPVGWQRLDVDQNEVWLTWLEDGEWRPEMRVMIRVLDDRAGAMTSHAASVLETATPPGIADFLGGLAYSMNERAAHGPGVRGAWWASTLVTQSCVPGRGQLALTTIAEDRAATMDELAAFLQLTIDAELQGCGTDVFAESEAMVAAGEAAQAARPMAAFELRATPVEWVTHQRFGLQFRSPAGMRVNRERAEPDRLELWLTQGDEDAPGLDINWRVLDGTRMNAFYEQEARSEGLLTRMSNFAGVTMENTFQQVTVGGVPYDIYRGSGMDDDIGLPIQVMFMITETVAEDGLRTVLGLRSRGTDEAEGFETLAQIISSVSLAGDAIGPSRVLSLYDERATLTAPEGMVALEIDHTDRGVTVVFGPESGLEQDGAAGLSFEIGMADPSDTQVQDYLQSTFIAAQDVGMAMLPLAPVWIEESFDDTGEETMLTVVRGAFQRCLDGQVVGFELLELGAPLPFDLSSFFTETGFLTLSDTIEVTDCIPALMDLDGSTTGPVDAPAEESVAPVPPATNGKDPVASGPSADDRAWEQALAADTPDAMLDYLTRYPTGAHAQDAQRWLTAYAEAQAAALAAAQAEAMAQAQAQAQAQAAARGGIATNLGDDDTLGRAALAQGEDSAYWTYLKAYPDGIHADTVRARLAGEPAGGGSKSR